MANPAIRRHLTERDVEVLLALDHCPLTVQQLLKLSVTFACNHFQSPRSVQDRLHKLREAGWVCKWTYATASRTGAPDYYKLTPLGYRLLHGQRAVPPTRRAFAEVGIAHQHHTLSLSDFIVHTAVSAHRRRIRMINFHREHTLQFLVAEQLLFPDCGFELLTSDRRQYNFLVELDNGTERVRSDKETESWQRKLRLYEALQDQAHPRRFRLLVVTTRSRHRLDHILALARHLTSNPQRSLVYGVDLTDYVSQPDAVCSPCFHDHHGIRVSLVPAPPQGSPPTIPRNHNLSQQAAGSDTVPPLPLASRPQP